MFWVYPLLLLFAMAKKNLQVMLQSLKYMKSVPVVSSAYFSVH